jgi:hypothetical protein
MVPDHARTGVPHHISYSLAHLRFITVHRAVLTGGFLNAKGALIQTLVGVIPEGGTLFAEFSGVMQLTTVQADHSLQRFSFLG